MFRGMKRGVLLVGSTYQRACFTREFESLRERGNVACVGEMCRKNAGG